MHPLHQYIRVLGAQGIALVASMVSFSLLGRLLGPEGYGTYALLRATGEFALFLAVAWTSAAVVRYGAEEFQREGGLRKTFWARASVLLVTLAVTFIALAATGPLWQGLVRVQVGRYWLTIYVICFVLAMTAQEFVSYLLQAAGEMNGYAILRILSVLIWLACVIALMFLPSDNKALLAFNLSVGASLAVTIVCSAVFFKRAWLAPIALDRTTLRRLLKFSAPVFVAVLGGYLVRWVDTWAIGIYRTREDVGLYQAAYNMMSFVRMAEESFITVANPLLVGILLAGNQQRIRSMLERFLPQMHFFWCLALIFVMLGAEPVIAVLLGPAFQQASLYFVLLCTGLSIGVMNSLLTPLLNALEWTRQAAVINLGLGIVNLGLDVVLVPRFGTIGAAIASVVVFSLSGLLFHGLVSFSLGRGSWRWLWVTAPVFAAGLALAVFESGALRYMLVAVSIVSLVALNKILGTFSLEDLDILPTQGLSVPYRRILRRVYTLLS